MRMMFVTLVALGVVFHSAANAGRARAVVSEDFGDAWPLTVYSGMVNCVIQRHGELVVRHAIFIHESGIYAMNGSAKNFAAKYGYKDIADISKPHPDYADVEADIGPLLDIALENCQ